MIVDDNADDPVQYHTSLARLRMALNGSSAAVEDQATRKKIQEYLRAEGAKTIERLKELDPLARSIFGEPEDSAMEKKD